MALERRLRTTDSESPRRTGSQSLVSRRLRSKGEEIRPACRRHDGHHYALERRQLRHRLRQSQISSHKPLLTKQRGNVSLSPNAKYAIYFDGKDWYSYSVNGGSTVNLTKDIKVNFYNEQNDTPSTPGSYGIAGWTKDDPDVLIYDRYDIWRVSPDGSAATNLTDGVGRKESTTLRYVPPALPGS